MPSPNDVDAQRADRPAAKGYPSERSFVVQLRSDADLAKGVVCGRVEHVVSSRAAVFDSLSDLARFFSEVVRSSASSEQGKEDRS
jgi:hypothetical protein